MGKCVESCGNLTLHDFSMHCKNLYELSLTGKMMCYCSLSQMSPFFTIEDICIGLQCLKAEMLKWAGKEAHLWISDMFNDALQHGMPYDWTTNWVKPL